MAKTHPSGFIAVVPLLLYGALFAGVLGYGYYLLLPASPLLGFVVALLLSGLALGLARNIADDGGVRSQPPMFVLLLLISAVGVFNSLFLNLESRQIFLQRIETARAGFETLLKVSNMPVEAVDSDYKEWRSQVDSGIAKLLAEIRNSFNCGQGPQARRLISDLQQVPLDFEPLTLGSERLTNCAQLADVYENEVFPKAITSSKLYRDARPVEREQASRQIREGADKALRELSSLNQTAAQLGPVELLQQVRPQLELQAQAYEGLVTTLDTFSASHPAPRRVDLTDVRSLGEWSQLANLIIQRRSEVTTWFYGALALFADWMLVQLFLNARRRHVRP